MKKGQSHIFLAILILMIGLALIAVLVLWLPEITFEVYPEEAYNKTYLRSKACLGIEEIDGLFGFLSIRNCGQIPLTNLKFFMDSAWFDLGIEKLDPQESKSFYDLPIVAGNHTVLVTADYAETPAMFINVPPYVCIEGVPLKREDWDITERTGTWPPASGNWVITDTTSCVCSYNSTIEIRYRSDWSRGNIYILGNGNLSIYKCILWYEGTYFNVEDNATLNFTKSTLDPSPDVWHDYVSFEGNSTIYLTNSSFANPSPNIQQATNATIINSYLGWFLISSNTLHNLTVSDIYGTPMYPNPIGSPMTNYIRAEGSKFTINFTNASFYRLMFSIGDSSNTTILNSTFHQFYIYSNLPHNLTINDLRGDNLDSIYFKAEGSPFSLNITDFPPDISYWAWGKDFYPSGNSNNTLINSSIDGMAINMNYPYLNSTNTFIDSEVIGNVYSHNNFTNTFINSKFGFSKNREIVLGSYSDSFMIFNFSNSTVNGRLSFGYNNPPFTNMTIFGNVTFNDTYVFYWSKNTEAVRYFPTIVKYANGNPASGTAYVADKFGNRVWNGNIVNSYTEPETLFDFNNYGPGNLTLYLIDDYEYEFISTEMPFLKNTPINLTIPYCDVFITSLPFTIDQSNTYYCLPASYSGIAGTAIDFSSGVQNSTLNCMYNSISGIGTDYGVYVKGFDTRNNTIKNCKITGFDTGILIMDSPNNTLFSNLVYSNQYGVAIRDSIDNIIMKGSIHNNAYDYHVRNAGTTNYFRDSNFTYPRKIYLYDTVSWFNYNNDTIERTISNLWLKTKASCVLTRELINWNQTLMQWNDTSGEQTTATYEITGLIPNTVYYVYNNSVFTYSLNSGDNGEISFIINLPQNEEHEIKVKKSYNILHFKFDEGSGTIAFDSSGYGNNGTLYNNTIVCSDPPTSGCPKWVDGKYGKALEFDGVDDYVETPDIITFNEGTIELWIKPSSMVNQTIFDASTPSKYFYIDIDDQQQLRFWIEDIYDSDFQDATYSVASLSPNEWYYIAGTWRYESSPAVQLYLNGNLVAQDTGTPASMPYYFLTPYIGKTRSNYSTYWGFNGTIDSVRIYDKVLTQEEIQADMNKG